MVEAKETLTLNQYKRYKIHILHQLGYAVKDNVFDGLKSEVQIDNKAKAIMFD